MNYTCFLIENFNITQLEYIINYYSNNDSTYRLQNFMPIDFKINDYNNYHSDLINLHLCDNIEPIYSVQTLNLTAEQISTLTKNTTSIRIISKDKFPKIKDLHEINWKNRPEFVGELNANNIDIVNDLLLQPIRNAAIFEKDIIVLEKTTLKDYTSYIINLNKYELIKNYCNNIEDINIEKIILSGVMNSFLFNNIKTIFNNIESVYLNLYDKSFNLLSHINFNTKQIYLYLKEDEINNFYQKFHKNQNNIKVIDTNYPDIITIDACISYSDDIDLNLIIKEANKIIDNY